MRAWEGESNFRDLLGADPTVAALLSAEDMAAIFDPMRQLAHIDTAYRRAGIIADEDEGTIHRRGAEGAEVLNGT